MYNITDINTGEIIEQVTELPPFLPPHLFPVQIVENALEMFLDEVRTHQQAELEKGYIDNGVTFGLSEVDQLNYNSIMNLVNAGESAIEVYGSTDTERYHKVTMDNATASAFFKAIFSHVAGILSAHRDVKILLETAQPEEYEQILIDNGIRTIEDTGV